MDIQYHTFDIAVLGAGPAGACSALFLAQAGFKVALVEKRAFAKAGPSWVNAIYMDALDGTGLVRPAGEEIDLAGFGVQFFSPDMQHRLVLPPSAFTNVRMRPFVDRLQQRFGAAIAGANLEALDPWIEVAAEQIVVRLVEGALPNDEER